MTTRNFVTEARKRRDALTDAIRRVRRDIKVATKSQDLAAAAGAAAIVVHAKNCPPRVRDIAVVLYLSHDDAGVTAKNFVEESLTRKWGTTADAEEFLNHIRDLAATVNFDDASTASWWTRRGADADRYMRERNLHDWIDMQNTRRGVAPTTRAIFARDEAADEDHGPARPLRERALHAALSRRQVQWTRRFMRRWSLRRGTLQVGSGLPTDEAAQKAGPKKRFSFFPPTTARKIGPGPILAAPFLGPKNGRPWAAAKAPKDSGGTQIPAAIPRPQNVTPGPPETDHTKARAMWQWANFLEAQLGARKPVVYLNFDESSCRLWTPPRRGLMSAKACLRMRRGRAPQQTATLLTRRTAFSLLAFLADNVDVQKSLPQFLVLNAHTLAHADARWLEHETKI